jgi:hypothetical protein
MSVTIYEQKHVRFIFTPSCSCLIYVICVCLRILVSNTYCVLSLFCFSSSYVPYITSFSGLSLFDSLFGIFFHLFKTKRDDFNFCHYKFSHLHSNIPTTLAYGVYILQFIRYASINTFHNVPIFCVLN